MPQPRFVGAIQDAVEPFSDVWRPQWVSRQNSIIEPLNQSLFLMLSNQ